MSATVPPSYPPLPDPHAGLPLHQRQRAQRLEDREREAQTQRAITVARRAVRLDNRLDFSATMRCPGCNRPIGEPNNATPCCWYCRQGF